ncbi:hypothetical protein ACOSQ3_013021 [Xanthoceras sorbifolium]
MEIDQSFHEQFIKNYKCRHKAYCIMKKQECRSSPPSGRLSFSVKTALSKLPLPLLAFLLSLLIRGDLAAACSVWSCWCAQIGPVICYRGDPFGVFFLDPFLAVSGGAGGFGSGGLELLWCSILAL